MNIYQKMSEVTAEIMAVAKNLNVGWGKSQYKAVGEADVLAAVKPIERKHGVYSYPVSRTIVESGVLTSVKADGGESRQQFMRLETVYRFTNIEDPDDYIDITTYGDGVDPQDKAPGKAMTYADKYALLKAYKIITGDDPDQEYSKELKGKQAAKKKAGTDSPAAPHPAPVISAEKAGELEQLLEKEGIRIDFVLRLYGISGTGEITETRYDNIMKNLGKIKERQEKEGQA